MRKVYMCGCGNRVAVEDVEAQNIFVAGRSAPVKLVTLNAVECTRCGEQMRLREVADHRLGAIRGH